MDFRRLDMRVSILAAAALGAMSTAGLAHPEGHGEEYYANAAVQRSIPEAARQSVVRLVSQARLPASWARVQPLTSTQRTRNGAQQWVVMFRNDAVRAAQRVLYVVMTPDGTFVSANHRPS